MRSLRIVPALLLIFVMAASCPEHPEVFEPNEVDNARSARLAADPWLAPAKITHGAYTGLNNISREEAVRLYSLQSGDPIDVALREVHKALDSGWFLTYVYCGKINSPMASVTAERYRVGVEVNLERSPNDPERAAFAQLSVYRRDAETEAASSTEVAIYAYAQYHSDKAWPNFPNVALGTTCLVTPGAPAAGQNTSAAFPDGIALGIRHSQPFNEKGEPDKTAR